MHGVTSTGNAGNRSTSGEGSSTGTTQGQTQGGRSAQASVMYNAHLQMMMDDWGDETEAKPITSRQATGSNTTESIQSQKGQCTQEFNLPELRYQATKDFFRYIEKVINAAKPGAFETKKPCNPVPVAESAEDTFDRSNVFDRMFDRTISKEFKRSCVQKDEFREKNTLPLCLMLVKKTTEALDGLIEELRAVRKSGSSETETLCDPEPIKKAAEATHQSLQKLEANKNVWTHEDALPLCQAVVQEMKDLRLVRTDAVGYVFMRQVMGPVYTIAYNGALADLKQQHPDNGPWAAGSFYLLVDISGRRNSFACSAEKGKMDLLISNLTMFQELFQRKISAYDVPMEPTNFYTKCQQEELFQTINRIVARLLLDTEKMKRLLESDAATKLDDDEMRLKCQIYARSSDELLGDLANKLSMMSIYMSSCDINQMTR